MLIEDIHYTPSPRELAYRIRQMAQSCGCNGALERFVQGETFTPLSNRQVPRPVNGYGRVDIRKTPSVLKSPLAVYNEINKHVVNVLETDLNKMLAVEKDDDGDLVVLIPDNAKRISVDTALMRTMYLKNIEQITRLITRLSKHHNRMKVASLVSKIDVFGSSDDRVKMASDLTQILVAVYQIFGDETGEIVVKSYIKPLEKSIKHLSENLDITTDVGSVMYVDCDNTIVLDSRVIDIDALREAMSQ